MQYTSGELFHFVGSKAPNDDDANYRTLLEVLRSGWVSASPHNMSWDPERLEVNTSRSMLNEQLVVPSVTCFCDIPPECLGIHCAKYGRFGIAFSRKYLVRYGARPVMYFPLSSQLEGSAYGSSRIKEIESIASWLWEYSQTLPRAEKRRRWGSPPTSIDGGVRQSATIIFRDFLAFVKPFDADAEPSDPKSYYMEREWRRLGNIRCSPSDVLRVVVADAFVERARSEIRALSYARVDPLSALLNH